MDGWDIVIGVVQFIQIWCEIDIVALLLLILLRVLLDPLLDSLNVDWRESFKQFTNSKKFLASLCMICLLITIILKIIDII